MQFSIDESYYIENSSKRFFVFILVLENIWESTLSLFPYLIITIQRFIMVHGIRSPSVRGGDIAWMMVVSQALVAGYSSEAGYGWKTETCLLNHEIIWDKWLLSEGTFQTVFQYIFKLLTAHHNFPDSLEAFKLYMHIFLLKIKLRYSLHSQTHLWLGL